MTEKIIIKAEQVVSRKGGYVSYYDDGSTLRKVKADTVTVLEPGKEAPVAGPQTQPAVDTPPAPVAETVSTGPTPEEKAEKGEPLPPEKHTKPSKRGAKPKEDADMATKTAAKKSAPKKAPAKKTAAPRVKKDGEKAVRTIGGKPVDISRYEKAKAPGGGTSYNNGDAVAERLAGKDLDAVYSIVAKALKVEEKELRAKYKNLNVGMQRMNLGNRLRKVAIPKEAK